MATSEVGIRLREVTSRFDGETFGYNLDARPTAGPAVLMVHGFTASTTEMRPLADYLHAREPSWPILVQKLSGHGGTIEALEAVTDAPFAEEVWLADVTAGLARLTALGRPIVLAGLSMGGALCCRLAARHPNVVGLVLLAPVFELDAWQRAAFTLLGRLKRRWRKRAGKAAYYARHRLNSQLCYPVPGLGAVIRNGRDARAGLGRITARTVIYVGKHDSLASADGLESVRAALDGELHLLESSRHLVTVEPDRDEVLEGCHRFIRAVG